MKYEEALRKLNQAAQHNLFVITGEEDYLARRYLTSLMARLNPQKDPEMLQPLDGNADLQQLYKALDSSPFFSEKNIIFMEEPKFLSASLNKQQEEQLQTYLSDIPPYNILILKTSHKLDKRKKLSKLLAKHGIIVECDPIAVWNIEAWLRERIRELNLEFEPRALMYMLEIIRAMDNISLAFINQELEKLKLIAAGDLITLDLLQENLSSIPEVSSYRLWDKLCEGKLASALRLYEIQLEAGMHPLKILGLLVKQIRQLWQVKIFMRRGYDKKVIAQKIGLPPFVTEKVMRQAGNFSLENIEYTVENFCVADLKLKTGQAETGMMERIFIEFIKGKNF